MEAVAIEPVETLTVQETARIIGKNDGYVRTGLITGRLPFGSAVKKDGSMKWDFNIIKSKVLDYAGLRGSDEMAIGDVSKLRTRQYIAYKVPANVLKKEVARKCVCSCCNKDFDKIWLVVNNDELYCDSCLTILEVKLDGFVYDWDSIKYKVAKYDKIFRA